MLEAVGEERDEGLTVRLRVKGLPSVGAKVGNPIQVGRKVEEALRSHEKAVRHLRLPGQAQGLGEFGAFRHGFLVMVSVAALGGEPAALRQRLQERGLTASVLADEERYSGVEREVDL